MSKISIDLIEEGKYRVLLMKLNKMQTESNKPIFTLEEFISMLLATPEIISMVDFISSIDFNAINNDVDSIFKEMNKDK